GDYTFRTNSAVREAISVLDGGPQHTYQKLTIPEGLTLSQIAERVGRLPGRSAAKFLQLAKSGTVHSELSPPGSTNLEGLLLPDTYTFEPKDDELAILKSMVDGMNQAAVDAGVIDAARARGLSPYQLVTIASLVEREARVDVDRPKIAQVIYN